MSDLPEPPVLRHAVAGSTQWEHIEPADAGFTADLDDRLNAAIETGKAPGLHGLVVARHGKIVIEHYKTGTDWAWLTPLGEVTFTATTLHDIRSVTKSVVALLYGIALADGHVPSPKESLVAQFPEYPDLAADPRRAALTVHHALTMTLGLRWREEPPYDSADNGEIAMMLAPDPARYVLEQPIADEPGSIWNYSGGATELIGRLIAKGTEMPLDEYARDLLFMPLGIGSFEWMAGGDGVAAAASGLRLATRDLARIGHAVLHRGRWDGRQIVPQSWLEAVIQPHTQTTWGLDYGYQWYLGGDGTQRWVGGIGNGDQRLFVFPELDLVVAGTTGNYDQDSDATAALVRDVLLPSVQS